MTEPLDLDELERLWRTTQDTYDSRVHADSVRVILRQFPALIAAAREAEQLNGNCPKCGKVYEWGGMCGHCFEGARDGFRAALTDAPEPDMPVCETCRFDGLPDDSGCGGCHNFSKHQPVAAPPEVKP